MRRILPSPTSDVDAVSLIAQEERPPHLHRPWVVLNMIATADGSVVGSNGRSSPLGGQADRAMFHALRGEADVILAGATTVRVEHYGPPRLPPGVQASRSAAGRAPLPRLAVASRSLNLDPHARMFQGPPDDQRPLVLTDTASVAAHPTAAASLAKVATIVEAGDAELDFGRAFAVLADDYATRVLLVEGGPSINGQLIAADLVDELCLTISPVLMGGSPLGIASGPTTELRPLRLVRVVEENSFLLLRYLRAR